MVKICRLTICSLMKETIAALRRRRKGYPPPTHTHTRCVEKQCCMSKYTAPVGIPPMRRKKYYVSMIFYVLVRFTSIPHCFDWRIVLRTFVILQNAHSEFSERVYFHFNFQLLDRHSIASFKREFYQGKY